MAQFDSKYGYPALLDTSLLLLNALKQNRWLLIEFIPAAPPSPSLFASVSAPGHGHIQYITTPPSDAISSRDVLHALKQSVLLNFEDVGWGEVGASLAGIATNTTWAALALLDGVDGSASGGGSSADGHKVVPHVIHVSGTLKHVQIAAIEWNRQVIARVKAGMDVSCTALRRGNDVVKHSEMSMNKPKSDAIPQSCQKLAMSS